MDSPTFLFEQQFQDQNEEQDQKKLFEKLIENQNKFIKDQEKFIKKIEEQHQDFNMYFLIYILLRLFLR